MPTRPSYRTTFISHAHDPTDDVRCANIASLLQATGIDVWIDLSNVQHLGTLPTNITRELRQRQALVLIVTATSDPSPWVGHEVNNYLAYSFNPDMRLVNGLARLIIPVQLEPFTAPLDAEESNSAKVRDRLWIDGIGKPDALVAAEIADRLRVIETPQWESMQRKIARRRTKANAAHIAGHWKQEAGEWRGILALDSGNREANTRLAIAEQNHLAEPIYNRAARCVAAHDFDAARHEINRLKTFAPYYGDPKHIGRNIGVSMPLNYLDHQQRELQRQQALDTTTYDMIVVAEQIDANRSLLRQVTGFVGIARMVWRSIIGMLLGALLTLFLGSSAALALAAFRAPPVIRSIISQLIKVGSHGLTTPQYVAAALALMIIALCSYWSGRTVAREARALRSTLRDLNWQHEALLRREATLVTYRTG